MALAVVESLDDAHMSKEHSVVIKEKACGCRFMISIFSTTDYKVTDVLICDQHEPGLPRLEELELDPKHACDVGIAAALAKHFAVGL